jgi:hypothetical protein
MSTARRMEPIPRLPDRNLVNRTRRGTDADAGDADLRRRQLHKKPP